VTGWDVFRWCLTPVRTVVEITIFASEQLLDVLEELDRA
jgi:hypothetical protein